MPPLLLILVGVLYFLPHLSGNVMIAGSDDSPDDWYEKGYYGGTVENIDDRISPKNAGTNVMDRRFGKFINPAFGFYYIFPKYYARTLEYLFWTIVAGLLMYWFLRYMGVSRWICFIGGLGFMCMPAMQSLVLAGHFAKMEVIALIPGIMLCTEQLLRKVSWPAMLGLPVFIAFSIYSRHLQMAYFVLLLMGLYFVVKMLYAFVKKEVTFKDALARGGAFGFSLVLAATMTAMCTFPAMHHTQQVSKRAGGVGYQYAASYSLHAEEALSFIVPDFSGWGGTYWGENPLKLNSEYFGVVFVALAFLFFLYRRRSFYEYVWAGIIIFAFLFTLGPNTPVHRMAYHLIPGIKSFRAPSMMYIWVFFGGIVVACFAMEELIRARINLSALQWKRVMWISGACVAVLFILMLTAPSIARTMGPGENTRGFRALMQHMGQIRAGAIVAFISVAMFFAVYFMWVKGKIPFGVFVGTIAAVVLFDAIRASRPFLAHATKPKQAYKTHVASINKLSRYFNEEDESLYRVHTMLGMGKSVIPDVELAARRDDFMNKRFHHLYTALTNARSMRQFKNILSFLNTKYVVTGARTQLPVLKKIDELSLYSGKIKVHVYKNSDYFPRYYCADEIIVRENPRDAIFDKLRASSLSPDFALIEPQHSHLVEKVDQAVDSADTAIGRCEVEVLTYDARQGHSVVKVDSDAPRVLICSENYLKGWRATVNGEPVEVFAVNYLWKGVVIPAGESRVEYTFSSSIATKYRKVTAASVALYILLVIGYGVVAVRSGNRRGASV